MGLSRAINKLSLISKLILLESLDKMVKSWKFVLQPQISKWSEIADSLTFLRRLFVKCEISIYSAAFDGDLKMTFNLKHGKDFSIAFCSRFLISNDFLSKNGKTQANSVFDTTQIFGCLINASSKYIFMQRSIKILMYSLFRKICFNFRISKCRVL